jgi:hypothetical protein
LLTLAAKKSGTGLQRLRVLAKHCRYLLNIPQMGDIQAQVWSSKLQRGIHFPCCSEDSLDAIIIRTKAIVRGGSVEMF